MNTPFATITCKKEISLYEVRNLLCGAFEGGSNYWLRSIRPYFAPGITKADFQDGGKFTDPSCFFAPNQLIPTVDHCGLYITVNEETSEEVPPQVFPTVAGKITSTSKEYDLNSSTLRNGLQRLANHQQQRHWNNLINENDDAETADVFLQLCLFGEIVYG